MRSSFLVALLLVASCSHPAAAQGEPDEVVAGFYSTCMSYGPDFSRMQATAAALEWKPLELNVLKMLAPVQKPRAYAGWVTHVGFPKKAIVAVTRGTLDGAPVQTCTVAIDEVDAEAIENTFVKLLKPRRTSERDDGLQVFHTYRITAGASDQEQLISIGRAKLSGIGLIVMSSLVPDRES